jgi:hypothetical protein
VPNQLFTQCLQDFRLVKMLEWRERENKMEDHIASNDPNTMLTLRECRLDKFFLVSGMRAQVQLLEYLVRMWDTYELIF